MEIADNKLNISKVDSPEHVAAAAYELFVSHAVDAIDSRDSFKVAISGGQTPMLFYQLLGRRYHETDIQWDKVHIFWVDERCVPPDAVASNYGLAAQTFLNKIPIPPENIHRMYGELQDYVDAVHSYESVIRQVFNLAPGQMPDFDIIYLGMGTDGHIGSLFRNSYALFDTEDLVSTVYMMDGNYSRMTLTHPVLCAARHLAILISGPEKARIVQKVLLSEPDEVKYPAHTLWPILEKVTWIIDNQAGKWL